MQIHSTTQLHGIQSVSGPHASRVSSLPSSSPSQVSDQLDLSPAAQVLGQLSQIPDIRQDRVAQIRAALADGTYETADKLSTALDRLLDEIA